MPRSAILTGQFQQRDRAQLRTRLDRRRERSPHASDPGDDLETWFGMHLRAEELALLEGVDLTLYLRDTAHVALPPEERLRRLATLLEPRLSWHDEQPRAWLALERIYTAALQLSSTNAQVHQSRAITAQANAIGLRRVGVTLEEWTSSRVRRRMMKVAYEAASDAVALMPPDADVLCTMGDLCYRDPDRGPGEALRWYESALAQAPSTGWASLYRAHCLHDLGRWSEAAEAYDAVNPGCFVGPTAWRYEHLLEQRAYCRLRAGEIEGAQQELEALLQRWEDNPHLAAEAFGEHLAEAARGSLRDRLLVRTLRLCQREEDARGQGQRSWASYGGLLVSLLDAVP